jgi:hypothetical protein
MRFKLAKFLITAPLLLFTSYLAFLWISEMRYGVGYVKLK